MGSAYWYYLALNVLSFVMDCSSSAAWITPITQTSSSKGNANATFFWYFESSEPYNKFSVLFGDAEDDVIEIDPTIPETLRFNNAVDLKCGDHVDGTNNVYCVSIEVNMGSGSYVCTVDFPTNPTLTDTAQLTVLDPTCPSPGKCTWEVTDETIDVTPESTSPPVMVMLMVKNVIVAACEASSTNPTCSLKSKRADYTNEEKGQLQLHRCGGTPVDDSIYLNPVSTTPTNSTTTSPSTTECPSCKPKKCSTVCIVIICVVVTVVIIVIVVIICCKCRNCYSVCGKRERHKENRASDQAPIAAHNTNSSVNTSQNDVRLSGLSSTSPRTVENVYDHDPVPGNLVSKVYVSDNTPVQMNRPIVNANSSLNYPPPKHPQPYYSHER